MTTMTTIERSNSLGNQHFFFLFLFKRNKRKTFFFCPTFIDCFFSREYQNNFNHRTRLTRGNNL